MGRILDRMEDPSVRYEWWGKPNHEPLTFGYRRAERNAIRRLSPRYGKKAALGALAVVRTAVREGRLQHFDAAAILDAITGGHRRSMLFSGFVSAANHRVWVLRDVIARLGGWRRSILPRERRLPTRSYVGEQLATQVGTWRFENIQESDVDGSMLKPLNGRADFGGFTFDDLGHEAHSIPEMQSALDDLLSNLAHEEQERERRLRPDLRDADVTAPEVRDTKALVAAPRPGPFASVMLAAA